MNAIRIKNNYEVQYVIFTYGLFGLLIFSLGGVATFLMHGTPLVMKWLTAITAWTPTYVFLVMFKKLYPNSSIKSFYKKAFSVKLNIRLLAATTIMQIAIFASSIYMVSIQRGVPAKSLLDFSYSTMASALFFTLIQGPAGEESGWRGYLLPAIEKKTGVIKGSLIVSLIWAFWHAPIWFLDTGYEGTALIRYIIVFVICITSFGFILGVCYLRCKNLIVPIWMHFLFNFLGETNKGSRIDLVTWYAALYFIMAAGFFLWIRNNKKLSKTETRDVTF
ncbi:MAG: type II CAAX endopeptidase family protein [Eubacteriales bacterium]|nr:type II CAAX endopeptidase family protein [Eubacteriales bacterium]